MRLIEKNPKLANNIYLDNNKIEEILNISYSLRIIQLVYIIGNISMIMAILWIIGCEIIEDFGLNMSKWSDSNANLHPETFIHHFNLQDVPLKKVVIISLYYAFTSLSTVGFGDFHPRSDVERLTCAFILLLGVACFSYIMGNFIAVLEQFKAFHQDLDDGDMLSKFFGTIKKFNNNVQIDMDLKRQIEAYFAYKWTMDKNMAFKDAHDRSIFD